MPRGDGTGPRGMGAMTGCAARYLLEAGIAASAVILSGRGLGRRFRRGRGAGRGWRNMFCVTGLPEQMRFGGDAVPNQQSDQELEKEALKSQAEALQLKLDLVKKRLGEIETGTEPQ